MKKFLLLTFLILQICSCSSNELIIYEDNLDYDLISEFQISWNDIFNQKENEYLVYFYSQTCGYCEDIKEDILRFYKDSEICMYFVSDKENFVIGHDINNTIGCDDISSFYIIGTPTLVEVCNHSILMNLGGVSKIYDFLFQIN